MPISFTCSRGYTYFLEEGDPVLVHALKGCKSIEPFVGEVMALAAPGRYFYVRGCGKVHEVSVNGFTSLKDPPREIIPLVRRVGADRGDLVIERWSSSGGSLICGRIEESLKAVSCDTFYMEVMREADFIAAQVRARSWDRLVLVSCARGGDLRRREIEGPFRFTVSQEGRMLGLTVRRGAASG